MATSSEEMKNNHTFRRYEDGDYIDDDAWKYLPG